MQKPTHRHHVDLVRLHADAETAHPASAGEIRGMGGFYFQCEVKDDFPPGLVILRPWDFREREVRIENVEI